jgi:hypothetical protein
MRVVSLAWSGDMRWGRNGKAFSVGRLEEEAEERGVTAGSGVTSGS